MRMPTLSQIFARRIGRIAFGLVLLIGVANLATEAWSGWFGAMRTPRLDALKIIALTWAAAFIAGVIAWAIAGSMRWSRDPESLFSQSLVIPTLGVALLLPITFHLPVVLILADAPAFDIWVMASLWVTGITHVVFAILCAVRGHQLVADKPAITPRKIYIVTLITSCVPFVALWAIPPALVAITALPFVPMLHGMQRLVLRERIAIASATRLLPRAVAMSRPLA